jgi:hypothetical protein
MHKSKLAGFIIDCQTADLAGAAGFWGGALGMAIEPLPGTEGQTYARLADPSKALNIEVQTVDHPSRVHLDIETDNIEAEVRRLEALGATRIKAVQTWVVMQAPTGQRFCVVRQSSPSFASTATTWP